MLYLFNTTIAPNEGLFLVKKITRGQALAFIQDNEFTSAIGHEATAEAFSALTGMDIKVNRIHAQMEVGDMAVCLKINGRLKEGEILTIEKMEEIGYQFYFMKNLGL